MISINPAFRRHESSGVDNEHAIFKYLISPVYIYPR